MLARVHRRLLSAAARRAEEEGDWPAAVALWRRVASMQQPLSAATALRLGVALRRTGDLAGAERVFLQATVEHPTNLTLAMNAAHLAWLRADWAVAAHRGAEILERHDDVPVRAWRRTAHALLRHGDLDGCLRILDDAIGRFGPVAELLEVRARVLDRLGDAAGARETWEQAIEASGPIAASTYTAVARLRANAGDLAGAAAALDAGGAAHRRDRGLHIMAAGVAMVLGDWISALTHWDTVVALGASEHEARLPARGLPGNWHTGHWAAMARAIVDRTITPPDVAVQTWLAVASNVALRSPSLASSLLRVVEPGDARAIARAAQLRSIAGRSTPLSVAGDGGSGTVQEVVAAMAAIASPPQDALGAVPIVEVVRGSDADMALRAARFVTRGDLDEWIERHAAGDEWPETTDGVGRMEQHSMVLSREFARRYADELAIPEEVLADAVFLPIEQMEFAAAPCRRIAAEIAGQGTREPVFVELPWTTMALFDPAALDTLWPVVLVDALRRRGVPAALVVEVCDEDALANEPIALDFIVSRDFMSARAVTDELPDQPSRAAVFPAGVRSLRKVVAELDAPLVLAGDAIVSEFAYDRSRGGAVDYAPHVSVLPERAEYGSLRWPAHRVDWDRQVVPCLALWTTAPLDVDLLGLVRRLLGGALSTAYRRFDDAVDRWKIDTAHVADHLYASAALFSGAVERRGGKVVLWPHSTNPVHVEVRRRGSFDAVAAVTTSGVDRWSTAHPGVEVVHRPDLMLDWAQQRAPIDPAAPLHVVLIGGKPMLGLTPFVAMDAYWDSVRRTVTALQSESGDEIVAVFKPKGTVREVDWLDRVLAGVPTPQIVLEHPSVLDLPNMVFVSIGLGSSALLEGLSRGVPGLIVRDFPVVDYTTLTAETVPVLPLDEALGFLRGLADTPSYRRASDDAVASLSREIGVGPAWE